MATSEGADVTIRGRRLAQLLGGRLTEFVFPPKFTLRSEDIETKRVSSVFLPWTSEIERMSYEKIASYRHLRGMISDELVVETAGGTNDLRIQGLSKGDA